MTLSLPLEPITADAFAPFGQLVAPGVPVGGQTQLVDALWNGRAGARPCLSFVDVAPKPLPLAAVEMERHVHSSQAFVPMDCAAYLVLVAPRGADGMPDLGGLRAFRVPGDTAVNYRADTWHHPVAPLDRAARFAVLTFVDGTAGDTQLVRLPEPVSVEAASE